MKSSHAKCSTLECTNATMHGSGKCMICRHPKGPALAAKLAAGVRQTRPTIAGKDVSGIVSTWCEQALTADVEWFKFNQIDQKALEQYSAGFRAGWMSLLASLRTHGVLVEK